jgi:F0F1-type ATP synthase membrane subunit b/b'
MKKRNREINIFSLSALDLFCGAMGAFILLALISLPYYKKDLPLKRQITELKQEISRQQSENQRLQSANQELQAALEQCRQALQQSQADNQRLQSAQQQLQEAMEQSRQALQQAQAESQRLQNENQQIQASMEQCRESLQQALQQAQALQEKLFKTFLIVAVSWDSTADIDLHVYTPRGNHYYFDRPNHRSGDSGRRPNYPDEDAELSLDAKHGGAEIWHMPVAEPGQYKVGLRNHPAGDGAPALVKGIILFSNNGSHSFKKSFAGATRETEMLLTINVDNQGNVTIRDL